MLMGTLEIDHERGVIYFHVNNNTDMERYGTGTVLRICSLPTPIPQDQPIDITHMVGVSYSEDDYVTQPKEGFVWPVCPWHDVPADKCPTLEDGTLSEGQNEEHVTWHCLVMVDAGILEEVGHGRFRLKKS